MWEAKLAGWNKKRRGPTCLAWIARAIANTHSEARLSFKSIFFRVLFFLRACSRHASQATSLRTLALAFHYCSEQLFTDTLHTCSPTHPQYCQRCKDRKQNAPGRYLGFASAAAHLQQEEASLPHEVAANKAQRLRRLVPPNHLRVQHETEPSGRTVR